MDGMKAQSDCSKRILMRVGLEKNDDNHFGYKNSIFIDTEQGFIRRFVVTPACIYDNYLWVDSPYYGEHFKDLLSLAGFENSNNEKGLRNHPLGAAATDRNSISSQTRARVENVFGCLNASLEGIFTGKLALKEIMPGGA
jgi:transposase, IS5 family